MRPAVSLIVASALLVLTGAGEPLAIPADFKVRIEVYGPRKDPLRRAELMARKGRAYWVMSESNEVIIYDPAAGVLELLDLGRMQWTDLPLKKVDDLLGRWRKAKLSATDKLQEAGGRANELAAGMARDLVTPKFEVAFDAAANRLRLSNASVNVDVLGEPEADAVRRAFQADALVWFLKLETIRDPRAVPPFPAFDALKTLTGEHPLRPAEVTFVYRLAGPPRKVRWTYRLEPTLSEREAATIAKIDRARERARFLRFDRYEQENDKAAGEPEVKRSPEGP